METEVEKKSYAKILYSFAKLNGYIASFQAYLNDKSDANIDAFGKARDASYQSISDLLGLEEKR